MSRCSVSESSRQNSEKTPRISLKRFAPSAIVFRLPATNRLDEPDVYRRKCVSRMLNYTEQLTLLMEDVVARVPTLSFISVSDLLIFARAGKSHAEGAFATCHCLTLPASEPGYYFWRDRMSGRITRRSEWFVTKSPSVTI